MLAENSQNVNALNLAADIPKPEFSIGDLIEQTFTYKEQWVTVIEVAQIIGYYFHPHKKLWEYMVYWIQSSDPLDVRPMFEETPISFITGDFEDNCVIINIRKLP